MPADLINLRQTRKARARAEKEAQAAENRAKFGRTKAERQRSDAITDLDRRRLDANKIDSPDDAPPPAPDNDDGKTSST
jgi:Domain of unknown function (DUF4169)